MTRGTLDQTLAELARAASCAWEENAKRYRGIDGYGAAAAFARREWEGLSGSDLTGVKPTLRMIAARERAWGLPWHSHAALNAIQEYERSQET